MNVRLSLILMLTVMASCSGHDGRSSSPAAADSKVVRDFVQDFYNWYVPVAGNSGSGRPADLALQNRASAFDPSLARQLKEDSDAQAKVHDDIVGLDFDPFLSAQDPCDRYEVLNVQKKAESYLVDVRGVGGCEKHDAPDVIAEVASGNGVWVFVNFRYPGPDQTDLLTVLKRLRDERR
jgi:hypothetical protein